ncbi:unnamed protein product [Arctogadus glacialis]
MLTSICEDTFYNQTDKLCRCIITCESQRQRIGKTRTQDIMVNFVSLAREHWVNILVPMGFVIGWYMDKQQDQKLTAFRNRSALYGRELKPGEEYTWK